MPSPTQNADQPPAQGRKTAPRHVVHTIRGRPGPDDRPTLPSGHPVTWDGINEGTCIAGAPYPFPIFWP